MSSVTSVTFDKPQYVPGETITVTANGSWGSMVTVTVTTADGATGSGSVPVAESVHASDGTARVYNPVSNTGTVATFTALA